MNYFGVISQPHISSQTPQQEAKYPSRPYPIPHQNRLYLHLDFINYIFLGPGVTFHSWCIAVPCTSGYILYKEVALKMYRIPSAKENIIIDVPQKIPIYMFSVALAFSETNFLIFYIVYKAIWYLCIFKGTWPRSILIGTSYSLCACVLKCQQEFSGHLMLMHCNNTQLKQNTLPLVLVSKGSILYFPAKFMEHI